MYDHGVNRNQNDLTQIESELLIYATKHTSGFHGWQFCRENPAFHNPTVYRALARLEAKNYLRSIVQPNIKHGVPPKRLYVLTFDGQSAQVTAKVVVQPKSTKTTAIYDVRKAQASSHSL